MAKTAKESKKKEVIDETKKSSKKDKITKNKNDKKRVNKKVPKESYFTGVKSELSKVKWPNKKEVLKYTVATIAFVLILVGFFILMSLIMSGVKGAFN